MRGVSPNGSGGVSDGTRTRDILDHNQTLYQLSYTHQAPAMPAASKKCTGRLRGVP